VLSHKKELTLSQNTTKNKKSKGIKKVKGNKNKGKDGNKDANKDGKKDVNKDGSIKRKKRAKKVKSKEVGVEGAVSAMEV
jgi:hypothetical protein